MDCKTAEPFVSELYDGENVPQEAIRHIMDCPSCRDRLQDYAHTTSKMRLLAAEDLRESNPPLDLSSFPPRRDWLAALGKSIRVPRVAVAMVLAALAIVTAGWVRTAAQNKVVTYFWCEIKQQEGRSTGVSGQRVEVGELPGIDISRSNDQAYAWKIEALSITDQAVVLRIRLKHFTQYLEDGAIRKEIKKIAPQQITYTPGQQITVYAEGGGSVILSGTVKHEGPYRDQPKPAAALLPAADEIKVAAPALIRDRNELIAYAYSGTQFRCNTGQCGFYIYAPGHGVFFFSTQPLPDGIQGMAAMSAIQFREGGHEYTLLAAAPITGGEQPRKVWIVHVPGYLPSQHRLGGVKSDDALVLGQSDLSTLLAAPLKKQQ